MPNVEPEATGDLKRRLRVRLALLSAIACGAFCACQGGAPARETAHHSAPLLVSTATLAEPTAGFGFGLTASLRLAVGPQSGLVVHHGIAQTRSFWTGLDGRLASGSRPVTEVLDQFDVRTAWRSRVAPLGDHFVVSYVYFTGQRPPVTREVFSDGGLGPRVTYPGEVVFDAFPVALPDGGALLVWSDLAAEVRLAHLPFGSDGGPQVSTFLNRLVNEVVFAWGPDGQNLIVYSDVADSTVRASRMLDLSLLDRPGVVLASTPNARFINAAWSSGAFEVAWVETPDRVVGVTVQLDAGVSPPTTWFDLPDASSGFLEMNFVPGLSPRVAISDLTSGTRLIFADGGIARVLDGGRLPEWQPVDGGYLATWIDTAGVPTLGRFDPSLQLLSSASLAVPLGETVSWGAFTDGAYQLAWAREGVAGNSFREYRGARVTSAGVKAPASRLDVVYPLLDLSGLGSTLGLIDARGLVISFPDGGAVFPNDAGCSRAHLAAGTSGFLAIGTTADGACWQRISPNGVAVDATPLELTGFRPTHVVWDGARFAIAGDEFRADGGTGLVVRHLSAAGLLEGRRELTARFPWALTALGGGSGELLVGWTNALDSGTWLTWLGSDGGLRDTSTQGESVKSIGFDGTAFVVATNPVTAGAPTTDLPSATYPLNLYTSVDGVLVDRQPLGDALLPHLVSGPPGQLLLSFAAVDPTPGVERLRVFHRFIGPIADAGVSPPSDGGLDAGAPDGGQTADGGEAADAGASENVALRVGCGCGSTGDLLAAWLLALLATAPRRWVSVSSAKRAGRDRGPIPRPS